MPDTDDQSFFAQHPKLMGALFTALMLLTQVGSAVATNASAYSGP